MPLTFRRAFPWTLALSRFALGPAIIGAAYARLSPTTLSALLVIALLSDLFDGVLARRWGTVTPALRVTDSWADVTFYGCVAVALSRTHPALAHRFAVPLTIMLALYPVRWIQDLAKYRRLASYHAVLSRVSGAILFFACLTAFLGGNAEPLFWGAFVAGIACHLEAMAISAVLPVWTHDVSGLCAALRLRKVEKASIVSSAFDMA